MHQNISFGGVPAEKRLEIGRDCLARLIASESAEVYAELFWDVAGYDDVSLRLILEVAPKLDDRGVQNIAMLIGKAIPRLAFTNTSFARELLAHFTGKNRERLVEAFAYQARRYGGGVFAGNPEDLMAQQQKQFTDQVASFPVEPGLCKMLRSFAKVLRGHHRQSRQQLFEFLRIGLVGYHRSNSANLVFQNHRN